MTQIPFFMIAFTAVFVGTVFAGALTQSGDAMSTDVPRIFRIILPVSDIERAATFYADLLGIEGERVSPGRHYFHAGEVILAVMDPKAEGDGHTPRPNQDHVYLAVKDLEAVYTRAKRLGGLSDDMGTIAKRPWGELSFYMTDPFGNPLCFVDETTLFTGNQ